MRARLSMFVTLLLVGAALVAPARAEAAVPAGFTDTPVAAVVAPTGLAFTPDGRLLVSSQRGQIRVVKQGALLATPALDLSARICTNSERGVLGVAADPDPATRWVYVFYTPKGSDPTCPVADGTPDTAGAPRNRVSRFTLSPLTDTVDPASEVVLLDGIYSTAGYHNAGDLHVGHDGYLYVTTGDGGCDYRGDASHPGGSGCGGDNDASRDRNVLNGKVLRITTSGGIPADNPFTGTGTARCRLAPAAPGTVCQETYAWGLRNPFRFAFDPDTTGTRFRVDDVGQNVWEEIDQGTAGADYGWNGREGHCQQTGSEADCGAPTPAGMTDPVYDYPHSTTVGGSTCGSITGGAYVPAGVWPAAWSGSYLFGDYVCGAIFALSPANVRTTLVSGLGASSAVDLAFGPDGAGQSLYYTSYAGGGEVRRIAATGAGDRAPSASLTVSPAAGAVPLDVTLSGLGSSDPDGDPLSYRWDFGDGTAAVTTSTATTTHRYATAGTFTARLTVTDGGGLSGTATATVRPGAAAPLVTITSPTATQTFTVGGRYVLHGSATDGQGVALPASALSWTVVKHHAAHTHPFLGPVAGNDVAITGPPPEDLDAATTSYLEIRLTATNAAGVATTVTRDFQPAKVPVTVATSPAGRTVEVNGLARTAPTTVTSWAGYGLQLAVPVQADAAGVRYRFASWSDGGAAGHTYATPATAATVTASLTGSLPAAPTVVTVRSTSTAGAVRISWEPPADLGGRTVTGYRVSRDGTDAAGVGAYATVVGAATRTYTMTRLVAGRTYDLTVRAVTAAGDGAEVTEGATADSSTAIGSPAGLSVRQPAAGQATIAWAPPVRDGGRQVTGYRVSRDGTDSAGQGAYSTVVSASTRSFTMTRLVAGRSYHLAVAPVVAGVASPPASRAAVLVE